MFGPTQSGLSVSASPHKYLSPPPPSHFEGILANVQQIIEYIVVICNKKSVIIFFKNESRGIEDNYKSYSIAKMKFE